MTEDDETDYGCSKEQAERLGALLQTLSDADFYDRTNYKQWDVLEGLQRCFLQEDAHPEEVEFLRALWLALLGLHPKFRITIEHPTDGSTFAPLAKAQRHQLATEIAQKIDVAVARGAKLEAEVQLVCDGFGFSRREVFRFLKETRERRRQWRDTAEFDGYECPWPVPEGLMIDPTGKLVPNS